MPYFNSINLIGSFLFCQHDLAKTSFAENFNKIEVFKSKFFNTRFAFWTNVS